MWSFFLVETLVESKSFLVLHNFGMHANARIWFMLIHLLVPIQLKSPPMTISPLSGCGFWMESGTASPLHCLFDVFTTSLNLQFVCLHDLLSTLKVREYQSNSWRWRCKISWPIKLKTSLNSEKISWFALAQDFSVGFAAKG